MSRNLNRYKIKVFISSKCDAAEVPPKYNPIRAELKRIIEQTGLADVYTFESEGASTLSAGNHYSLALEDSDVCIFLIDNADGISPGVQKEIDIVQKNKIMALYYFCDETQQERTPLEKSLQGANCAKSKTVHSFGDLSKNSASALINDIVMVYRYYCKGTLQVIEETNKDEAQDIAISAMAKYQESSLPKSALKNIDKCTDYILKESTGISLSRFLDESVQSCELDEWGLQFLPILFEGKSIKAFNTSFFLQYIKQLQTEAYFEIVSLRWDAIQEYFNGRLDLCIKHLNEALEMAKRSNQASWIINDIRIDLRNQHFAFCTERNSYSESEAQKELNSSTDELYYPIIDRSSESLQEKYIQGLFKKKVRSPYTVSLGSDLNEYGKLLATIFIVALFNGSLTHLILLDKKIRDFLFYLSSRYDDWHFRLNLLKYTIKLGNYKEVDGIKNAYPEILRNLSEEEAVTIMDFCSHHPIYYRKVQQQFMAFGTVGYYLSDSKFSYYEAKIINTVHTWLDDEESVVSIGDSFFKNLSNVAYRLSQDKLVSICCKFMDKHFSRWYRDMFSLIARRIDISKVSLSNAQNLLRHIILVLQDESERQTVNYAPGFLCALRNQRKDITEELDKTIEKFLPEYYENDYKLETTNHPSTDFPKFIAKYVQSIKTDNENQGKNGVYSGGGKRKIATIKAILLSSDSIPVSSNLMDSLVETVTETLLKSKESISTKMDAVSLLCCIIEKYPQVYARNKATFDNIYKNRNEISAETGVPFSSNIDSIALRISLDILFLSMEISVHNDLIQLLPYLKDHMATTISVSGFIADYLEMSSKVISPKATENILLYNALSWTHMDYLDVRWNATRILFGLLLNPENQDIINRQIVFLIDTDNVYIKNLILRRILKTPGITEDTKKYVLETCKCASNFVTRMICKDIDD